LGGPIFDVDKLNWLNGMWIREDLDHEQLADRLIAWGYNRENLLKVLPHAQQRMETLSDFAPLTAFLLTGKMGIQEDQFVANKLSLDEQKEVLQFALWRLEAQRHWERDRLFTDLKELSDAM